MEEKEAFTDTVHCLSRAHCGTCRDLEGGRGWRNSLMRLYVLPGDTVDFECPYGKAWGEPSVVPLRSAPKSTARKSKGCGTCSRAQRPS